MKLSDIKGKYINIVKQRIEQYLYDLAESYKLAELSEDTEVNHVYCPYTVGMIKSFFRKTGSSAKVYFTVKEDIGKKFYDKVEVPGFELVEYSKHYNLKFRSVINNQLVYVQKNKANDSCGYSVCIKDTYKNSRDNTYTLVVDFDIVIDKNEFGKLLPEYSENEHKRIFKDMEGTVIKTLDEVVYTHRMNGSLSKSVVVKITDTTIVMENKQSIRVTDTANNSNIYVINKQLNWCGMTIR